MNRNRTATFRVASNRPFGFSLVELLVVMAISSVLFALVAEGMQAAMGDKFTSSVSQIANTIARARAYAMANNTYVFVGIQEVSAANSSATTPQATGAGGRIGVAVVATNDGTRGYLTSMSASTAIPSTSGTQLIVISPLAHYDNVHIYSATHVAPGRLPGSSGSSFSGFPATGTMCYLVSQTSTSSTTYGQTALTKFTWPVGATTAQYTFGPNTTTNPSTVIQFDPQGEAQIFTTPTSGNASDSNFQWIEFDLEPTHGTTIPSATSAAEAASILIDGPSGGLSIYRS